MDNLFLPDESHCDSFIDRPDTPPALRDFLAFERQPASKKYGSQRPVLFATYHGSDPLCADCVGRRCRVVMASRFGDVGVRFTDFDKDRGYSTRCLVSELSDFSSTPASTSSLPSYL